MDTARGICRSIGADRTIEVLDPDAAAALAAGGVHRVRGPGLAQAVQSVDALLASTQFHSS